MMVGMMIIMNISKSIARSHFASSSMAAPKRKRYSWESAPWEADPTIPSLDGRLDSEDEEESTDFANMSPADAGDALHDMLVSMKSCGTRMTARHATTLAFFCV